MHGPVYISFSNQLVFSCGLRSKDERDFGPGEYPNLVVRALMTCSGPKKTISCPKEVSPPINVFNLSLNLSIFLPIIFWMPFLGNCR